MNLVKSILITSYMSAVAAAAIYAAAQILAGDRSPAWIGVLLATVPLLSLIGWAYLSKRVARTTDRLPAINALGAAGVALAGWSAFGGGGREALIVSAAAWGGFLLYSYWLSGFGGRRPSERLKVGSKLPHFTVRSISGQTVASEELTKTPAVLMFFRGNWCPLCMSQIREIAGLYREIEAMRVRVALISPQPHHKTAKLAKKFDVRFDFLTDERNAAARALGIENRHGLPLGMQMFGYANDTVLPTVIITDQGGRIIWTHETDNYRVRPEPETFLKVLRDAALREAAAA